MVSYLGEFLFAVTNSLFSVLCTGDPLGSKAGGFLGEVQLFFFQNFFH